MFEIKVELEQDNQQLGEVVVVADAKKNTENAIITQQRTSLVMQTGVSAQQITKTQDKDASELGTALLLIHTLLYRCESPRTITNFSSIILIPGTRRITSGASLSCVLVICWAEAPVCITKLVRCWVIIVPYLVLKPMRVLSLSILFHRRSWIICW